MYNQRIKVLIIIASVSLGACVLKLAQMQLMPQASIQDEIAKLKEQQGDYRSLKTLRGKILDRNGRVLATDEPRFHLDISYQLSRFADARVQRAMLLEALNAEDKETGVDDTKEQIANGLENIRQIMGTCAHFGADSAAVEDKIQRINDKIWNKRVFQVWSRQFRDPKIVEEYGGILNVPAAVAEAELERLVPDEDKRISDIGKIDISDMRGYEPILELKTDADIYTAQIEFSGVEGVQIQPEALRTYPYGSAAAQTIGWVGVEQDKELFAEDKLSRYLEGEISGRRPGVEYVCEAILRGRRGEEVYDIDEELVARTETQFGRDVQLSLDIELQKRIEEYLRAYDYDRDANVPAGMAAVVIEVASGDILAMVSLPNYDLNRTRYDYGELARDKGQPLLNRAVNQLYPPGSAAKPLILIAGMESGKITADEPISCTTEKAPEGWPNCWVIRSWRGHDDDWRSEGGNKARNAIKGSCNIYFSRLADRVEPLVLQQWLFAFGYGRAAMPAPATIAGTEYERNFRQAAGMISSSSPQAGGDVVSAEQLPAILKRELRFFGIGQGSFRVTPLQVANAMAAIARGGVYAQSNLYLGPNGSASIDLIPLGVSPATMSVVRDGMHAVTNEYHGTAYDAFKETDFASKGVQVYGKTGSTTGPEHAWFGGFAEDQRNRGVAIAIVLEGGQSGGNDAAPAARDIISLCVDAGYIGNGRPAATEQPE